jgi:hypothetical protein
MWVSVSSLFAIILVITLFNMGLLALVYALIRRIPNRAVQILLPVLVMLAGYLVLMKADPTNLILGTHFFVAPMTVLLVVLLIRGLADPASEFTRILVGDFLLSVIAVIVLGFVTYSQYLNTIQYYRNMALSNGITYACVIVFDFVLATVLFRLMRRGKRRYPVRAKESE